MSNTPDTRSRNIAEALKTLNVDSVEAARNRLATECRERLGLEWWVIDRYCRHLEVERQHDTIISDKRKFYLEGVCLRLGLTQEELKAKLYEGGLNLGYDEVFKLRQIMGVEVDRREVALRIRSEKTKRKEERLIEMWNAGASYLEIAKALKTTEGTVIQKVHRLRQRGVDLPLRKRGGRGWLDEAPTAAPTVPVEVATKPVEVPVEVAPVTAPV
jgi:hypothetical protein